MVDADGTIIPSYFDTEGMGARPSSNAFGNMVLRQGEIREVIYPDDPRSVTKTVVEYSVAVQVRDGNGPAAVVNYPNCQAANLFGGTADKLRYTYRAQAKDPEKGKVISDGSKVQILCVNGELRRAFIVGGINEEKTAEAKNDGHNLRFEFNGVQVGINNDGEMRVEFRGATQTDGKLTSAADANASGSSLVFSKDGSIKAFTASGDQFIYLNHKNKRIEIHANKEWNVTSDGAVDITAQEQVTITGRACSIDMDDRTFIRSAGLYVGTASDAMLLGETHRRNQKAMHNLFTTRFAAIANALGSVAANLQVVSGLLKVPIFGPIAASAPLQIAATTLNVIGPMFTTLSDAVNEYEAEPTDYLSVKNRSD